MSIIHNIPSTLRRPGQFHELDLTSSQRGLRPLDNPILLVGMQLAAGAAATANTSYEVPDASEGDRLFGKGSEASLMCRKALQANVARGFGPPIYAAGLTPPGGGTAAIHKITVTAGTAAAAGDIVFKVGEVLFRAGVSVGDNQDAVALAIVNAIKAKLELVPVTPTVNGVGANIADLTVNYKGENGSDLKILILDVGLTGLTIAATNPTAGVGVSTIATALANSLSKFFEVFAIANRKSADVTALDTHLDEAWGPSSKRDRFAVIGDNSTLSTSNTLASGANDYRTVIGSYEASGSLPCQIAAAMASEISAREAPNYNWDAAELPLDIPPEASVYIDSEIESALAAGVTPLRPNEQRTHTQIVRLVTTKTTEGGAPFERAKDLATIRTVVYLVRQLDAVVASQFKGVNMSTRVLKRLRSAAYEVLDAAQEKEYVRNVEALKAQLVVEADSIVPTRALVSVPEDPVPNLHQVVFKHVLFVGA